MTDSTPAIAACETCGRPMAEHAMTKDGPSCLQATVAAPTRAEVRAAAQERAFWLRVMRDLVTYHGDRPWSERDYATAADVLILAAQARNV